MSTATPQAYRGQQLGLPESGPGSLAGPAARVGALLVDCVASGLVAALGVAVFGHASDTASRLPGTWSLVPFALDYVLGLLGTQRDWAPVLDRYRVDVVLWPVRDRVGHAVATSPDWVVAHTTRDGTGRDWVVACRVGSPVAVRCTAA